MSNHKNRSAPLSTSEVHLSWGGLRTSLHLCSSRVVSLPFLDQMSIPRCYKPSEYGSLASVELHHFANCALRIGLVRFIAHLFLVRAWLHQMTIQIEFVAAVLAVKVNSQLWREFDLSLGKSHFRCDSTSVLGYIKNEQASYHMFIANRIAVIHENWFPSQWSYVPTGLNPTDDASRGLEGEALVTCDKWKQGPRFLWES